MNISTERIVRDIREIIERWRTIDPDFDDRGLYDCDAIRAIAEILDVPGRPKGESV